MNFLADESVMGFVIEAGSVRIRPHFGEAVN